MSELFSLSFVAARLSAVAASLAAALADEAADPLAPLTHLDRALDLVEVLSWGLCREPATFPVSGLAELARDLAGQQMLDCGAPRCGPPSAGFADQVAQVILGAAVLAEATGIDLDAALARRAATLRAGSAPAVPVTGGRDE